MRYVTALRERAGRRGVFLLFLALLDLSYGYGLLAEPPVGRFDDLLLPWVAWGWIWTAIGVICAAGIFAKYDGFAFSGCSALFAGWAMLYVQLQVQGIGRSWISAVVWAAFALAVLMVAGWPDPGTLPPPRAPDTPRDAPREN